MDKTQELKNNTTEANESSLIISNYYRYYKTFALSEIVDYHQGLINWIMPKAGEKGPSLAFNIRLNEATAEKEVQEYIKGIQNKSVPELWFVTPDAKPNNIIFILEQNGFQNLSINTDEPGMLLQKEDFQPYNLPESDLICRKVKSKDDFRLWIDVVNTALHGWEMIDADHYYTWIENQIYDVYLGEINGIPVSTAATIRNGDTASLEFVSTLKEYRGKRAATAISSKAISELFENGIKTVTLSGSIEAVSLYQKLGFHNYFTNILLKYNIPK